MSLSNYRKIESTQRRPQRDMARLADEKFDCPETFERRYEEVLAEPYPEWFGPRIVYEDRASGIHEWEMRGIPGLAQTPTYTRSVVRACEPYLTDEKVAQYVNDRMARQDILRREHPPKLWFVLSEGVLRQVVGGPVVMREQLDHLITLADAQRVVLQVLPFASADMPGMNGPITLFEFDDGTPQVGYLEGWMAGQVVEDPKAVAEIADSITIVKSCAASPTESMQLVARIRSEL